MRFIFEKIINRTIKFNKKNVNMKKKSITFEKQKKFVKIFKFQSIRFYKIVILNLYYY